MKKDTKQEGLSVGGREIKYENQPVTVLDPVAEAHRDGVQLLKGWLSYHRVPSLTRGQIIVDERVQGGEVVIELTNDGDLQNCFTADVVNVQWGGKDVYRVDTSFLGTKEEFETRAEAYYSAFSSRDWTQHGIKWLEVTAGIGSEKDLPVEKQRRYQAFTCEDQYTLTRLIEILVKWGEDVSTQING